MSERLQAAGLFPLKMDWRIEIVKYTCILRGTRAGTVSNGVFGEGIQKGPIPTLGMEMANHSPRLTQEFAANDTILPRNDDDMVVISLLFCLL